jgi:hypothetical protein
MFMMKNNLGELDFYSCRSLALAKNGNLFIMTFFKQSCGSAERHLRQCILQLAQHLRTYTSVISESSCDELQLTLLLFDL